HTKRGQMEIAAGVARRDLPLFSCSYNVRTLHGICVTDEVRWEIAPPRFLVLFSCVFCLWVEAAVGMTGFAVAAASAGWDPSGEQIAEMKAVDEVVAEGSAKAA
ncbi:MAG: hypothetical protein QOE06_3671, partial [Thermoleophilaceae bacterium]|nr:hypothetical protein [Thermoleophilaceae bacterium]